MFCCAFIIILVIAFSISAALLMAACHLAGEEVPDFGKAFGIVFVTALVQAVVSFVLNLIFGIPMASEDQQSITSEQALVSLFVSLLNIPITMWLYCVMIPTSSFGKAALVWLIQVLIVLAIAVAIVFVVVGFSLLVQ